MSLSIGETEGEMNEVRLLNTKLDRTQKLVDSLVEQLTELKEEVCSLNYMQASFFPSKIHSTLIYQDPSNPDLGLSGQCLVSGLCFAWFP